MTDKEIIEVLAKIVGYNPDENGFCGNITNTYTKGITYDEHYAKCVKAIDRLPWINVKKELPNDNEKVLVLLDCNEHMILDNYRTNGYWSMFNTHVKAWMKLPVINKI